MASSADRALGQPGGRGTQTIAAEHVSSLTIFALDLRARLGFHLTGTSIDGEDSTIWQPMVIDGRDWFLPDGDVAESEPSQADREWLHVEGSSFESGPLGPVLCLLCSTEARKTADRSGASTYRAVIDPDRSSRLPTPYRVGVQEFLDQLGASESFELEVEVDGAGLPRRVEFSLPSNYRIITDYTIWAPIDHPDRRPKNYTTLSLQAIFEDLERTRGERDG